MAAILSRTQCFKHVHSKPRCKQQQRGLMFSIICDILWYIAVMALLSSKSHFLHNVQLLTVMFCHRHHLCGVIVYLVRQFIIVPLAVYGIVVIIVFAVVVAAVIVVVVLVTIIVVPNVISIAIVVIVITIVIVIVTVIVIIIIVANIILLNH